MISADVRSKYFDTLYQERLDIKYFLTLRMVTAIWYNVFMITYIIKLYFISQESLNPILQNSTVLHFPLVVRIVQFFMGGCGRTLQHTHFVFILLD